MSSVNICVMSTLCKYIRFVKKILGYCTNIEEYCPEQYIILHELASAICYTARDNIPQY